MKWSVKNERNGMERDMNDMNSMQWEMYVLHWKRNMNCMEYEVWITWNVWKDTNFMDLYGMRYELYQWKE